MQRKLKSVFRSSSKRKSQNEEELSPREGGASPRSQHDERMTMSFEEQRPRQSSDSYKAQHNNRSRPLSSVYDSRRLSNPSGAHPVTSDFTQSHPSQRAHDSIASDYKAYLPALSPVHDAHNEDPMSLGGDRRLINGESDLRHEEDVADRNIDRYSQPLDVSARKPLPAIPGMCHDESAALRAAVAALVLKNCINGLAVPDVGSQRSPGDQLTSRYAESVTPATATGKYSLGRDLPTKGGLVDSILPHSETSAHEKNQWKNTNWPARSAREDTQVEWSKRRPRGSMSEDDETRTVSDPTANRQDLPIRSTGSYRGDRPTVDGQDEIHREIEQLLDGVIDLRSTVDEDKDVEWAPGT
jgi:hypothetical protein